MSRLSTSTLSSLKPALPIFTGLLGLLGLGGGIYNFIDPHGGAKGFGLIAPTSNQPHAAAFQQAYVRIHGLRNAGVGLTNLALLLYLQFSDVCQTSPVAAAAVRKCLGIGLTLGTLVGLGDAWILRRFEGSAGVEGEAKTLAAEKSTAHALTSLVILSVGLGWLYT
jgi:hypothetical protein